MTTSSEETGAEFRREALLHLEALIGLGLRLTGGDASGTEERVRETIHRAYRAREDVQGTTNLRAWLMAILRDIFLDEFRERGRRPGTADRDPAEPDPAGRDGGGGDGAYHDVAPANPEEDHLDRLADREVAEAIEDLEDGDRVPLVLADLEVMSYRDIAETMQVSVSAVTSRLFRARRRLQSELYGRTPEAGKGRASGTGGAAAGPGPRTGPAGERGGRPGDIGCPEAVAKVYEYLDGELDPETQERIHRHVEICQRCHSLFDFERRFLDSVRDRGLAVGDVGGLRRRLEAFLDDLV
jgi:RNA polymerase sigma-70 factor (ECF subfamily)